MKSYIKYFILLLVFTSCEEVIEKRELDAVDNADVWHNADLATLYLNRLYNLAIPGFNATSSSGLSEEAAGSGPGNLMYGQTELGSAPGTFGGNTYSSLREINILLSEIEKGTIEEGKKNLIVGQALFLRAWIYWQLVKYHGGVPLLTEAQDPIKLSTEEMYVERKSAAQNVEFIVNDLDNAIAMLPPSWPPTEYGRVTRAAAAALKGRVLLFYASPQFNPNDQGDRWTAAYQANKEAKRIADEDGYGLFSDYSDIFLEEGNKEAIFVTVFAKGLKTHGYENGVRPASVSNSKTTSSNPTWDMVESYPMQDGKPAVGHPDYDPETYWMNRDPRFYATIAYNGVEWKFNDDIRAGEPRQWAYLYNDQERNYGTTPTGFYLRKNIDESIETTETSRTPTDWVEIRYAEVLLNLAESANEAGQTSEAYDLLKEIRERAGIEAGAGNMYGLASGMSTEEMRDAIMLERKIELAYENKRHWDLRRRNLFLTELNGNRRTGIQVTLDTAYVVQVTGIENEEEAIKEFEDVLRGQIDWEDPDNHKLFFNTTFGINLDEMDINFLQPKYNFYPIQQSDLDKDPKLKQTVGWAEGDTFDPLAP